MAANFWTSSHFKRWLFSKEDLAKKRAEIQSRTRLEPKNELLIQAHYIRQIQSLGKKLQYQQMVMATATTFFRRFYLSASVLDTDPRIVAPTVVYIAAKVEEMGQIRTENVIKAWEAIESGSTRLRPADIFACEMTVLDKLNFDLVVFHPYQDVERFVNDWNQDNANVLAASWGILNDSQRSECVLIYPPCIIALAAVYLASVHLNHDIKSWFDELNINAEEVRSCALTMMESTELDEARSGKLQGGGVWKEYSAYWKTVKPALS